MQNNSNNFAPPEPTWRCLNCGHVLYDATEATKTNKDSLKSYEPGPDKCPKCGSDNITNMHLQIMKDPS